MLLLILYVSSFQYFLLSVSSLLVLLLILSLTESNLPGGPDDKASACNAGDPGLIPGSGRSPWRRKWQPTSVLMPGKFHGWRSLVGYSPWGRKELDTTE